MRILKLQSLAFLFSRWLILSLFVVIASGAFLINVRGAKFDVPPGGFEGDVSSRTEAGKGSVTIADWVLIGRFVSGAETPSIGGEFQRADCAPKGTKGDGYLTMADWVQAGRYATGVDEWTAAGGPTAPVGSKQTSTQNAVRDLRIVQTSIDSATVNFSIEYEAAGNENAFGFSINFDPAVLGNPQAAAGSGVGNAQFIFNPNQAAQGKLGFAIGLSAGQTISTGVKQLATLSFSLLKAGLKTDLTFGNQPVGIEIVGADAGILPAPATTTTTVTINNPVPTLTSLNPTSATTGGTGFTLTVNGTNFNSTSIVQWNGTARPTTFVSATQLQAAIAAADIAAGGSANISVLNPAPGGGTTSALSFAINNPLPVLSSLNPTSTLAGSGATTVQLNGSGFILASTAQVNGTNRATTFVNGSQLTISLTQADLANAGTLSIAVINTAPGGGTSAGQTFTINNPVPTITSLSQTTVVAGSAGFTLTVNGTNFVGTSKVRWNGSDRATTFVNATQLTATIPASDLTNGGTANITVFNPTPGGGTSGTSPISITNPVPTITSLAPDSIASGSSQFTVTVNGTGFVNSSIVRWNGSDRITTYVSSTQITAAIPATDVANSGTAKISVFNPAPNGGISGELTFTIVQTNPTPALTSINPSTVNKGGSDFQLTVTGSNFVGTSKVKINGADRVTTFVSTTQLKATILAADIANLGTADITVFSPTPGGGTTSAVKLTVVNPPPIPTSLSTSSIIVGTNSLMVDVIGTGFQPTSIVKVNGSDRTTTFVSSTQLTVKLNASDVAVGSVLKITVATPAPGGGTSGEISLTVNNPVPTISALDPPSTFNTLPAFTLTVNGTNFVTNSVVRWNGADRTTTYVSAAKLTAAISAADIANVGTAAVTVFNPTPGGGTSNTVNFTIEKLTGYEADVTPRPTGNNDGTVTIADWVQVGRFFVGLDTPANGSEFQRADCAPKSSKGDGQINITDWVQAGRYAAGLDPVVVAGGPVTPIPPSALFMPSNAIDPGSRTFRIKGASFSRDQIISLPVEIDAVGNESAFAFSLNFDPALMSFADAKLGEDATGAALNFNRTEAAQGRIAVALAFPVGQSIPAGTKQMLTLRFVPTASYGEISTQVSFGDQLINRQISDANANLLSQAKYTNATVKISGNAATNVIAASYLGGEVAADSIVSAFGTNLATTTESLSGSTLPLTLGGTRIKVADSQGVERDAVLFFVSPSQINYQIPAETADGLATITITNQDGITTRGIVNISRVAPGIFSADATGQGLAAANIVYVKADNRQVWDAVAHYDLSLGRFTANPINVSEDAAYLVLYGTGIKNRSALSNVTARVDGVEVPVEYAGAQGTFFGVDQINFKLPPSLAGHGEVRVELIVDHKIANSVNIVIK